jgi:hypothetical protein
MLQAGKSRVRFPMRSFNFLNLYSCNMALVSTEPLTEMSTRNLPGGKGWPARKANNLTTICEPIVEKMWESRRLTTLRAFMVCYRDRFTFILPIKYNNLIVIFWPYNLLNFVMGHDVLQFLFLICN